MLSSIAFAATLLGFAGLTFYTWKEIIGRKAVSGRWDADVFLGFGMTLCGMSVITGWFYDGFMGTPDFSKGSIDQPPVLATSSFLAALAFICMAIFNGLWVRQTKDSAWFPCVAFGLSLVVATRHVADLMMYDQMYADMVQRLGVTAAILSVYPAALMVGLASMWMVIPLVIISAFRSNPSPDCPVKKNAIWVATIIEIPCLVSMLYLIFLLFYIWINLAIYGSIR